MKLKTIAPLIVLLFSMAVLAADGGEACGRLVGARGTVLAPLNVVSCPAL